MAAETDPRPSAEPDAESLLAREALERGFVTRVQLEKCVAEMDRRARAGEPMTLGQLLLQRGFLTSAQFLEVLRALGQWILQCPACDAVHLVAGPAEGRTDRCRRCRNILVAPSTLGETDLAAAVAPDALRDSGPLRASELIGQSFGKYDILEEAGRGAMGLVFKARDRELGRIVALKVLREEEGVAIQRFLREAQTAARLRHPNIVSIHDVGVEWGLHYLVMDFIDGPPLDAWLIRRRMAREEALRLLQQVALAVHHSHQQGVVHRDLKPANILVAGDAPFVTDFGLAKGIDHGGDVTRSGVAVGTPYYMSPEQVRGEVHAIDGRSDVYSLGVMMYEILTRRCPFTGGQVADVYVRILHEEPVPPRRIDPKIPVELETVCLKAMEKERERRYQSAEAFAQDIARFLRGDPIEARPVSLGTRIARRMRRHRAAVLVGLAAVIALAAGAAGFVARIRAAARREAALIEERERRDRVQREAEPVLAQARKRIEDARLMLYVPGKTLDDMNRVLDEAVASLDGLLERQPDLPAAHALRGEALWLRQDWEEAAKSFTAAIDRIPTAPTLLLRARIYLARYRHEMSFGHSSWSRARQEKEARRWWEAALADLRRAIDLGGSPAETGIAHVFVAVVEGDRRRIIELCTRHLPEALQKEDLYLFRGRARAELGEIDAAIQDFTLALKERPNLPEALLERAVRFHDRGRNDEALRDLEDLIRFSPRDAGAYSFRALVKVRMGKAEEAMADSEAALRLARNFATLCQHASVLTLAGRFLEAVAAYENALEGLGGREREAPFGYFTNRGWAKSKAGDVDGAIADYNRALSMEHDANAYSNRADLKKVRGDVHGAVEDYSEAIRLRPKFGPPYTFRADAYRALGETELMLADLAAAIERTTPNVRYDRFFLGACAMRADHFMREGRFDRALEDWSRALDRDPKFTDALANRGLCCFQLGRYKECVADLEEVLKREPGAPDIVRRTLDEARAKLK